jgi:hypothetical protein
VADEPLRRVLVLLSERRELPGNAVFEESLRGALASAPSGPVEVYSESLDVARFSSPVDRQTQVDFLRRRYANKNLDLVITVGEPALEVVAKQNGQIFPATPILASGASTIASLPPTITSVIPRVQMGATFELALRLHPRTRRVVVVAGTSPYDRIYAAQARRELRTLAPGLEIAELGEGPMSRVLEAAAAQPPDTVIFYLHILRDGDGRQIVPREALARIASVANAPIYGVYETLLGHGIVGGHVYSFTAAAQQVASVALSSCAASGRATATRSRPTRASTPSTGASSRAGASTSACYRREAACAIASVRCGTTIVGTSWAASRCSFCRPA